MTTPEINPLAKLQQATFAEALFPSVFMDKILPTMSANENKTFDNVDVQQAQEMFSTVIRIQMNNSAIQALMLVVDGLSTCQHIPHKLGFKNTVYKDKLVYADPVELLRKVLEAATVIYDRSNYRAIVKDKYGIDNVIPDILVLTDMQTASDLPQWLLDKVHGVLTETSTHLKAAKLRVYSTLNLHLSDTMVIALLPPNTHPEMIPDLSFGITRRYIDTSAPSTCFTPRYAHAVQLPVLAFLEVKRSDKTAT